MTIKILSFGGWTNSYYHQLAIDYLKRLNHYESTKMSLLKEITSAERIINIKRNTELLIENLQRVKDTLVIILASDGLLFDSVAFSKVLLPEQRRGNRDLLFVIGPSDGLDLVKLKRFLHLSLGRITLPHQLCRIVLLEQIYRSFKILNHERYHK